MKCTAEYRYKRIVVTIGKGYGLATGDKGEGIHAMHPEYEMTRKIETLEHLSPSKRFHIPSRDFDCLCSI
jgi:hypothetical protein